MKRMKYHQWRNDLILQGNNLDVNELENTNFDAENTVEYVIK